jgi:hypothetical protein
MSTPFPIWALGAALLGTACGVTPITSGVRCPPGSRVSCTCPSGATGESVCGPEGVLGPCECEAPGDGGAQDGGTQQASIDFNVFFRDPGAGAVRSCMAADVSFVRFRFLDAALSGLLRTEVTRPCSGGDHYLVEVDAGAYHLVLQGLNSQTTVCYETQLSLRAPAGASSAVIAVPPVPQGRERGCRYPFLDGGIRDGGVRDGGMSDGGFQVDGGNDPPVCICDATPAQVPALSWFPLMAPTCTDPQHEPLRYEWSVAGRPPGSSSSIEVPGSRDTRIFLDTPTSETPFVLRVTVSDPQGASTTCEQTVNVVASDLLFVHLSWDREGTDLDLHLLNPEPVANPWAANGWFDIHNDCHYLNPGPDWGVAANLADNPYLAMDDTNGLGPEVTRIQLPQAGVYTVGVHYFCDNNRGPSQATVRIWCDHALVATYGPKSLSGSGVLWNVAEVRLPGCISTAVDQTRTVSQGCQGSGGGAGGS